MYGVHDERWRIDMGRYLLIHSVGAKHLGDNLSGNPKALSPNALPCLIGGRALAQRGVSLAFGYTNLS